MIRSTALSAFGLIYVSKYSITKNFTDFFLHIFLENLGIRIVRVHGSQLILKICYFTKPTSKSTISKSLSMCSVRCLGLGYFGESQARKYLLL